MLKFFKNVVVNLSLLVISLTFYSFNTNSNPRQIRFSYITTYNGLPQNTVDCILKDSRGFMWFGTWNGVCRYDGYSFKTYQRNKDLVSLPGNFIQTLCEDNFGNIWIGTDRGLVTFDFGHQQFVSKKPLSENVANYSVSHIMNDKSGNIWVATAENGLWKISYIDNDSITCTRVFNDLLLNRNITNLCLLNDNHLLIGTNNGVVAVNLAGGSTKPEWKKLEENLFDQNISKLFQDSKGNVWAGTKEIGLFLYEINNWQTTYFGADNKVETDLNHFIVNDIVEDNNGIIIVGTLGGLNYFNYNDKTFSHLSDDTETTKYLNNPFVNSLYADDDGNIWIGTEKGGINYYSTFQKPFYSIIHEPGNSNTINNNTINSVFKENNTIWIGTAGGGLNKLSANGEKNTRFEFEPENERSISSNFISSIFRDKNKNLWVATWGGGINLLLSENKNQFRVYNNISRDHTSICDNFVSCFEELDKSKILVGTRNGMDIFYPSEGTFLHVHEKMNIDYGIEVGCLHIDQKERVWVGTRNGLFRFSLKELLELSTQTRTIKFDKFVNQRADSLSLPGNYIISITETENGNIWLGTYGNGICKYVENGGKSYFVNYSEEQGLCNNVAYAIEEDSNENLWISTDKGLSKFNPETEEFQNFYTSDGLLSDQFYWSASFADENKNLYFGGIEGLNYFSPEEIESYPIAPKPVFTEFSIFNNPVKVGDVYHSRVILEKSIDQTDQIQLSYKDAVFSIEFSALDYFLPNKIRYAYKMEGVDQNWVEVPATRRFANYTNLSGGEYIFKVKAANSDGVWNETPATLVINVKPPFWETSWFQILAAFILLAIVILYIRSRTRFLKEQKQKLEEQVRERTQQIEEQKRELENQNLKIARQRDEVIELNEKVKLVTQHQLRFFTNISHEFRTPLTLIIDPLEQLMQNFKSDKNTKNTLSIINRNAQRLLHLINQLLYFRRIENGKLNLNVGKGNLLQYLGEIFESFKELAEHQKIDYQFLASENKNETWFDAEKMENILYNLLSNAFKNTPVSGSIKMIVQFVENEVEKCIPAPFVSICIKDSGSGIAKEHLPYIFDRFYKAEQSDNEKSFSSSGIGLALTYEIVQALHGEIRAESEPGKGSSFTVCIPFTKNRFNEDEISQLESPTDINFEGRIKALKEDIIIKESGYDNGDEMSDDKLKPIVLIVEDNFDLRSFLMQTLHHDYRVLGAENGKTGFEIASKEIPDIVVSDIMMPVMDGIEMCKIMKQDVRTSHIPVVLLTAKESVHDQKTGYDAGADSYLKKPFSSNLLMSRLKNILEARKKFWMATSTGLKDKRQMLNDSIGELDKEFLKKLTAAIEANLEDDELNISYIATQMNMSHSTLYRKIKALTNLTANEFIRKVRINYAEQLLLTNKYNISEIMYRIGINSSSYFRQCFKEEFGMNPSEYLQKLKEN